MRKPVKNKNPRRPRERLRFKEEKKVKPLPHLEQGKLCERNRCTSVKEMGEFATASSSGEPGDRQRCREGRRRQADRTGPAGSSRVPQPRGRPRVAPRPRPGAGGGGGARGWAPPASRLNQRVPLPSQTPASRPDALRASRQRQPPRGRGDGQRASRGKPEGRASPQSPPSPRCLGSCFRAGLSTCRLRIPPPGFDISVRPPALGPSGGGSRAARGEEGTERRIQPPATGLRPRVATVSRTGPRAAPGDTRPKRAPPHASPRSRGNRTRAGAGARTQVLTADCSGLTLRAWHRPTPSTRGAGVQHPQAPRQPVWAPNPVSLAPGLFALSP